MVRTTNARLAGFTFLFHIAVAIASMMVAGDTPSGADSAVTLASVARHAPQVRIGVLLNLLSVGA